MMTMFSMSFARLGRSVALAAALLGVMAFGAFGQGVLTVSKNKDTSADKAMYTTVQAAVNAARPGDIIEIQDTEEYAEQVTIDSTKHGITLRSRNPTSLNKPVIKYRDTQNTSPKTPQEAKTSGDGPGTSGNFETCGALRVKRARGVTIDGITVDGGGAFVFGAPGVWCPPEGGNCSALFHGNAAITLVVSSGTVIRNCELRNAYFGVNVKDRNTGGIFGNPNPADNDLTVPLSGFGKTGNHLFEHNRVHGNAVGFFFESSWDLGVTVRYNLIYNNYYTSTIRDAVAKLPEPDNQQPCAFLFKDIYISPVAIYNNTLYNNYANFIGTWKIGGQHLIFNNIFGPSSGVATGNSTTNITYMIIDTKFPNRMKHCVFSNIDRQQFQIGCQDNYCANNPNNPYTPGGCFVRDVKISNSFSNATKTSVNFQTCNQGVTYPPGSGTQPVDIVLPGAIIPGGGQGQSATPFAADANIKWLEMVGGKITNQNNSITFPALFQSTDPTSPNFLEPKWDEELVIAHIKNKGWPAAGIRNPDGSMADLGAIPSSSKKRHDIVARIKPTDVVRITGTTAAAQFSFNVEGGDLSNPKIKYLKWIYQLPDNTTVSCANPNNGACASWADNLIPVPANAVNNVNPIPTTVIKTGNNSFSFTIPSAVAAGSNQRYGFFELTIEGTDKNGNTITSDVGFLPFRTLEYSLDIKFFKNGSAVTSVRAGEQVTMRVSPMKGTTPYTNKLDAIEFTLQSNPGVALMWTNETTPFTNVGSGGQTGSKDYTVFFKTAGSEIISGAGTSTAGGSTLPFLGTAELKVLPGDPAKVAFLDPIPVSQLGAALAPVINRGVDKEVRVEVQDKYNNAVDVPTPVTIVSDKTDIGDVGAPGAIATKTVNCGKDGIATFIARVTNGKTGDTFDMTASITANNASDKGRLRLGRALDRLDVFYSDTAMTSGKPPKVQFDAEAKIEGNVGDWFKITVRDVIDDTINVNQKGKVVLVSTDADGLVFSATPNGASTAEFQLTNGVAVFWVTGTKDVSGCVDVVALDGSGGPVFNGISPGNRCDITFVKPSSSIVRAIVYGDGHGRPDSVLIYYADGGAKLTDAGVMPDKVTLTWPSLADGAEITANAAALKARGDFVLHVDFTGVANRPRGYTSISGQGRGLVKVYGGSGGPTAMDDLFEVLDGVGPILTKDSEAGGSNPLIIENLTPGTVDTLIITVSEQIRDVAKLKGTTLFYTKGDPAVTTPPSDPAAGGTSLTVVDAFLYDGTTYKVAVSPVAGGLGEGDWIRLNPAGGVTDRAAQAGIISDNMPHDGNRWVQLVKLEVPPTVKDEWYTANSATGKVDYAYVVFDKEINLGKWFAGGSVKFDKDETSLTAAALPTVFFVSKDTLKIDLAVAFKSSQSSIRTSSPMSFTLNFASGTTWGSSIVNARDKAAPVLADAVILRIGSFKEDNTANPDTLVVVFSENPGEESLKLSNPITIYKRSNPNQKCEPVLKLSGPAVPVGGSLYYRATYLIDGDLEAQCPGAAFPEAGDSVNISAVAGFGDNMSPSNKQEGFNLKQPLEIKRIPKWTVKIKNNPFRSGAPGSNGVAVELSPSVKGLTNVNVSATIVVLDNLGALVLDTVVNTGGQVDWLWKGTNKRGRLVGTGTYLFKAVCKTDAGLPPETIVRSLGVVRGKSN